jgi:hypothetical protein
MTRSISKSLAAIAALAALALGGSALADAASNGSSSSSGSSTNGAAQQPPPGAARGGPPPGQHVGANGKQEQLLSGDTAAKVRQAALDKLPGGTIERVETDADYGSPYEAHVRKSDGTEVSVLVNDSFAVTAVKSMPQHP